MFKQRSQNKIWTKFDGTTINIKDMHIDHIINSLNMLERSEQQSVWINIFKDELKNRNVRLNMQQKLINVWSVIE